MWKIALSLAALTFLTMAPADAATVPVGLVGKTRIQAIIALQSAGFEIDIKNAPSCVQQPGYVTAINPNEGAEVSAVPPRAVLYISVGGIDKEHEVNVPQLRGKSFEQAKQELTALGLQIGDRKRPDEPGWCGAQQGPETLVDRIIEVQPGEGTGICVGSRVDVYRRIAIHYTYPKKGFLCP